MSVTARLHNTAILAPVRRLLPGRRFVGSARYWEERYADGGNSGAGSYGAVARFKADTLNAFVASHEVQRVIEFGCGDGAQLSLAKYPKYVGLDVSPTSIRTCIEKFRNDSDKSFFHYNPGLYVNNGALVADMAMSLDVILHLVEDDVLERYLRDLEGASTKYLVFFTEDKKPDAPGGHVHYRDVEEWAPMLAGWKMIRRIDNPLKGTDTQADFFFFERI